MRENGVCIGRDALRAIIGASRGGPLKRLASAAALLLAGGTLIAGAQSGSDARLQASLKQLFPAGTAFSPKGGDPPHYTALDAARQPVGYAFWTTELVPLERGYGGPIAILVGIEPRGVLAGVVVGDHREPYGDFSIDRPEFAAQFKGKDVRSPFRLGQDVDAVSRATITMSAAVRAVRTSVRRAARQLLTPPPSSR